MPEQHSPLLADRYELRTRIGRGTMGTVWRAYDRSLGREIAVKEIRQDPSLSPRQRQELRERMMREGRMAARVSHPSVATIHDVIVSDGIPWIIMELVEGRSLEQVIDEEGPLPPRLVAEIGYDLLGALRAAHARNILHRDVKPANVLLTETGRVVLTDFGIAKALGDNALTQTGMVIGSPGYTAPERARGEYTGPESDLWSLGATLYFAVEGRPAYERATVGETLAALMTEKADPPRQAGPLRQVLDGLLEKDHTARLTPERAAAILRVIADTPTGAIPAVPPAPPAPSPRPASAPSAAPAGPVAPVARQDGPAGADEDDANRTMVVVRPKGGLRIPPPGEARQSGQDVQDDAARPPAGNGSEAADRHSTTVPGRLPGRGPATPPPPGPAAGNRPAPVMPGQPAGPHPPHTPHPPHPGPFFPPGNGVPGRPPSLGTDLFTMRGPDEPDTGTRVRVLVTMGIVLVVVLVLILLGVFFFFAR
ncbi:serine/threonine-protein kinase [Microbispora sp. H10836]|uniref:serine/threonine-protein kinase n=1 Tax=Microbispora sp. H10836 TaxID=2729106 RepID=UPI001474BA13|nr:serine/threonine-protein kinase [Microbispora sp. H10836]